MNSRERVRKAIRHQVTDRVPIDLGGTSVSGIAAGTLAKLRKALGLPGTVKVYEPFQILGEVEDDLRQSLGVDTVGLLRRGTMLGYCNSGQWKPWALQDGMPVQISTEFEYTTDTNGDTLAFPCGDRFAAPSARLPKGGFYFDAIVRQGPLDEDHLDPQDWAEQFTIVSDDELEYLRKQCEFLYKNTEYSIVAPFFTGGMGDIAHVPGAALRNPKGLRDPNLWYEFLLTHPDYIRGIFDMQFEIVMKNLALYKQAVGDMVDVFVMSGTDFGTQRSMLTSLDVFRDLYKPYFTKMNAWVHANTSWKTFYHSCGAIREMLPDFVEMGVDIINPVQCSAVGMEAQALKRDFGDKLVFWGGGVDTQKVLPFGSVEDVRKQVRERVRVLGADGGYIFNAIHNIQHGTPVENVLAMFEEARKA
ncbi:MAG: hypothetical protein FWD53_08310 [Phycisphaerales bacterium]|nr:hypothetical protein [Phycisphaerales bacterium]